MTPISFIVSEADLNAYVDGQVDPHRAAQIATALDGDGKARRRIDAWKKQNESLRTLFASIVFEPVPVRLSPTHIAKVQAVPDTAPPAPLRPRLAAVPDDPVFGEARPVRHSSAIGAAVFAGAVLAAFVTGIALTLCAVGLDLNPRLFAGLHLSRPTALPFGQEVAKRAVEAHLTYATDLNRPVEIPASDEAHLVKWIQHRLTMPIRIPDLQPQGWNLIGGRVIPGELGPAAFVIYGNGVERLGLYIARTNALQSDDFITSANFGAAASVGTWINEPFGYAITTSRSTAWLERNGPGLFESVKAQVRDNVSAF